MKKSSTLQLYVLGCHCEQRSSISFSLPYFFVNVVSNYNILFLFFRFIFEFKFGASWLFLMNVLGPFSGGRGQILGPRNKLLFDYLITVVNAQNFRFE